MPRVVANQKAKFQTDALFKELEANSEIRYAGYCDCSLEERRLRLRAECYEGRCKIGFVCNGISISLTFPKAQGSRYTTSEFVDFGRDPGKVYLRCPLILNGVCVQFYGYLDADMLHGFAHLEFDENQARIEDKLMKETLKQKILKEKSSGFVSQTLQTSISHTNETIGSSNSCIYQCRRVNRE